jgi:putative transposase
VHGLLLQRDDERREERRHGGRVVIRPAHTRWCSDGLEITCDNGEKVRVAFALDCCDREAMGNVATTGGITAENAPGLDGRHRRASLRTGELSARANRVPHR